MPGSLMYEFLAFAGVKDPAHVRDQLDAEDLDSPSLLLHDRKLTAKMLVDMARLSWGVALRIEAAIAPAQWAEYKERHRASEVDEEA